MECGPILRAVQKVIRAKGSVQSAKMFHYVPITVAASECGSLRLRSGDGEKTGVGWGRLCGARRAYSSSLVSHGSFVSEQGHIGVVLSHRSGCSAQHRSVWGQIKKERRSGSQSHLLFQKE